MQVNFIEENERLQLALERETLLRLEAEESLVQLRKQFASSKYTATLEKISSKYSLSKDDSIDQETGEIIKG